MEAKPSRVIFRVMETVHHRRGSGVTVRTLNRRCLVMGLMAVCCPHGGSWPARSSDRVEVKIDGVVLPVSVEELGAFVRSTEGDPSQFPRSELSTWMTLLAPESKEGLIRLLKAPVLSRRSLGRQLLSSWGAGPLLDALGELIRVEDGGRINRLLVLSTLEHLLEGSRPFRHWICWKRCQPSSSASIWMHCWVLPTAGGRSCSDTRD